MSYSVKVANNTVVQLIGRIITTCVSFLIIGLLTRKLGVHGYGEYTIVFTYLGLYAVLADFGFFYLLVRKLSAGEGDPKEITSHLISIRTVLGICVYILSYIVALFFPYSSEVKTAIGIATISFLFVSIQNTIFGVFQVYYAMKWAVVSDVISRVITLGFIWYVTQANANLYLIVLGYVLGNGAGTVWLIARARRYIPFTFSYNAKAWKAILQESFLFGIAIVFSYLYFKVDAIMLSIMKGPSDVGIYAPSVKILEVLLILPQMFIGTVLPIYSKYIANKDPRINDTIQKTFDLLFFAMVPIVGGILITATPVVGLMAGREFLDFAPVTIGGWSVNAAGSLQILIFAGALAYLGPVFNYVLIAAGKQSKLVIPNIAFLLLNITLNFLLIPHFSYAAAAFSTIITELAVYIVVFHLAKKEVGFRLRYSYAIKTLLCGVLMVALLYILRTLPLPLLIIIGGVAYGSFVLVFKAIRPEIIELARKKLWPSHV